MKKTILMLTFVLLVLIACQAKPDEVALHLAEATNTQDLDEALALFADDAVVNSGGPVPFTGKVEIQSWLEGMFADNFQIAAEIIDVRGNVAIEQDKLTMDSLQALGVSSLKGISEITVQNGKITALNFTFSDDSLAELQIAMLKAAVPTFANVPYHGDDDPLHTLDIYLPDGQEKTVPTLFILHGAESTKEDFNYLSAYFVEQGYAAISTEFSQSTGDNVKDAACSLAWVHANADVYGFDPHQIVVFGYSTGGLIGTTLGTVDNLSLFLEDCPHSAPKSDWTQGVATYAAVLITPDVCLVQGWCMFGSAQATGVTIDVIGDIFEELLAVPPSGWRNSDVLSEETRDFIQYTPLYWVEGTEPPFLLIHGEEDEIVPASESKAFASYLDGLGVGVELLLLPNAGHLSISPSSPSFFTIVEAVDDFVVGTIGK